MVNGPERRRRRSVKKVKHNEIESGDRFNAKRQAELVHQKSVCQARAEACQSILNDMTALTVTATDSLNSLRSLLSSMNRPRGALSDFLECVECRNLDQTNNPPIMLNIPQEPPSDPMGYPVVPENVNGWPLPIPQYPQGYNGPEGGDRTTIVTNSNSTKMLNGVKVTEVIRNTTTYEMPIVQEGMQEAIQGMTHTTLGFYWEKTYGMIGVVLD